MTMNIDTIVSERHAPWLPNDDVSGLIPWLMDDVPTVGTFEMHGSTVLFAAPLGVDGGRYTTWVYVPLSSVEARTFEAEVFETVDELWRQIDNLFDGRPVVFAQATDFELEDVHVELPAKGSLYQATLIHLGWAADHYRRSVEALSQFTDPDGSVHWHQTIEAMADGVRKESVEEQLVSTKRLLPSSSC